MLKGASLANHLADRGWVRVPGLLDVAVARELDGDLTREVGGFDGPLIRVLTSRPEAHERDAAGRIINPIIHPGRLDAARFPSVHGLEQRVFQSCSLVALATSLLGGPVALLQSAWWPSSRGTPWHRDHNPLGAEGPMLGVWVALESVQREAGPFVAFDRSHRLVVDEALGRALQASEAMYQTQYVLRQSAGHGEVAATHHALTDGLARAGCTPVVFELGIGDAVAWDARVVHGSETPGASGATRSSLLFHFVRRDSV